MFIAILFFLFLFGNSFCAVNQIVPLRAPQPVTVNAAFTSKIENLPKIPFGAAEFVEPGKRLVFQKITAVNGELQKLGYKIYKDDDVTNYINSVNQNEVVMKQKIELLKTYFTDAESAKAKWCLWYSDEAGKVNERDQEIFRLQQALAVEQQKVTTLEEKRVMADLWQTGFAEKAEEVQLCNQQIQTLTYRLRQLQTEIDQKQADLAIFNDRAQALSGLLLTANTNTDRANAKNETLLKKRRKERKFWGLGLVVVALGCLATGTVCGNVIEKHCASLWQSLYSAYIKYASGSMPNMNGWKEGFFAMLKNGSKQLSIVKAWISLQWALRSAR